MAEQEFDLFHLNDPLNKKKIRRRLRKLRRLASEEYRKDWDRMLFNSLTSLFDITSLKESGIYIYVSTPEETDTHALISWFLENGVPVAVPRCKGQEMDFYYIKGMDDLEPGMMGILEPKISCVKAESTDAPMIVPGVAFGTDGKRIGYGGGYYDRFLRREPDHLTIGICYDFQIIQNMPSEEQDIPVKHVVTPTMVL